MHASFSFALVFILHAVYTRHEASYILLWAAQKFTKCKVTHFRSHKRTKVKILKHNRLDANSFVSVKLCKQRESCTNKNSGTEVFYGRTATGNTGIFSRVSGTTYFVELRNGLRQYGEELALVGQLAWLDTIHCLHASHHRVVEILQLHACDTINKQRHQQQPPQTTSILWYSVVCEHSR